MKWIAVLLLTLTCAAQDFKPTCVWHEKPCPAWLAKTIGPYPVPPDTIDSIQYYQPKGPRLFQFRQSWQDPPLATNRQVFRSKVFWGSTALMWAGMTAACLNSRRTSEEFHSEAPGIAALTGLSYLSYRMFSPSFSAGIGGAPFVHYMLSFRKK